MHFLVWRKHWKQLKILKVSTTGTGKKTQDKACKHLFSHPCIFSDTHLFS